MPVIEKRYATALADVCEKNGSVDQTVENFKEFIDLLNSNKDLNLLLLSHGIKNTVKKDTLDKIFGDSLDQSLKNLIFILLDKGRINDIQAVYKEFVKISNARKDVLNIKIFSSIAVTSEHLDKIKEIYKTKYNKKSVLAENVVDKTLMGGIKIQIGNKVIDASVKSRLNDLVKLTGAKHLN